MKLNHCKGTLVVATAALGFVAAGCAGSGVTGHTYADNGGVVKIEFKSGGKAYLSGGPITETCKYSQSGKSITLTCPEGNMAFTVDEDGALNGPPDGLVARLTKVK